MSEKPKPEDLMKEVEKKFNDLKAQRQGLVNQIAGLQEQAGKIQTNIKLVDIELERCVGEYRGYQKQLGSDKVEVVGVTQISDTKVKPTPKFPRKKK